MTRGPGDPAGVMLMAYGAPGSLDDVAAFFTDIRGGRRPPPERIEELKSRYARIGACDALLRITDRTARALQVELEAREPGRVKVFAGMRHSKPFISDIMGDVAVAGVERLVGLPLAPYYSSLSVGAYHRALEEAARKLENPPELILVRDYHDHPGLVAAFAEGLLDTLAAIRREQPEPLRVVFTAHSLPERILAAGEPYRDQLLATAGLVAAAAGHEDWEFAFQSASPTGEPWMGPDFLDVIRRLAAEGRRGVVVAPIGFVADHLEILYDVDVLARQVAEDAGMRFWRMPSLNDGATFVAALASIVGDRLGKAQAP